MSAPTTPSRPWFLQQEGTSSVVGNSSTNEDTNGTKSSPKTNQKSQLKVDTSVGIRIDSDSDGATPNAATEWIQQKYDEIKNQETNETKSPIKTNQKTQLKVDTSVGTSAIDWQEKKRRQQQQSTQQRETSNNSSYLSKSKSPINEQPRNCINSHIEERIGCCLDEFRCQHNNFTGILYVGPLGAVFLGRFLLFEWTVVLRWEEVTKVKRKASTPTFNETTKKSNAIQIETKPAVDAKNPHSLPNSFDFEGFFDSDKAIQTLQRLHNDTILDNTHNMNDRITKRGSVIPFRRTNSDPAKPISKLFNFDDVYNEPPVLVADKLHNPNRTTMEDLQNQYASDNLTALQKNNNASPNTSSSKNPDGGNNSSNINKQSLREEWDKVCQKMNDYPEVPVRDIELPLNCLDTFVEHFVHDDAPYSWSRFMAEVLGDTDIKVTPWISTLETNDDNMNDNTTAIETLTRTIDYTHPVNAPMAPPTARAKKEQILKRYGNEHGLVIETKTIVRDVPMTDCFYVRDVLHIERKESAATESSAISDADNDKARWVVHIRFEVVFVKSNMFRALINRTTTSEFQTIMTDLAGYICRNCGGSNSSSQKDSSSLPLPLPVVPRQIESTKASSNRTESLTNTIHSIILIALMVLLLWQQMTLRNETMLLREEVGQFRSILLKLETARTNELKSFRNDWKDNKQTIISTSELQSFRKDLQEWQTTLLQVEKTRATDIQSLRDDLSHWKSDTTTPSIDSDTMNPSMDLQSLVDDLRRWTSTLLNEALASSDSARNNNDNDDSKDTDDKEQQQNDNIQVGGSIPRKDGLGGPLLVEPVLPDRKGYRRPGRNPSFEEMNDWENLEQCQDCF